MNQFGNFSLGDDRFGPQLGSDGTTFRLWAPSLDSLELLVGDDAPRAMQKGADGVFSLKVEGTGPGTRYRFRGAGLLFPDLAARQQDTDSRGWSVVRAPLAPSPNRQPIRPWHETVLCEVHVGTATPEGTFDALRGRLEHFRDAGFTALEVMPVNSFPGQRNWGYDGNLIFAPAPCYGTPEAFRALVDRAHELGLCIILDVVYNHFGEVANYPRTYVPEWFEESEETPWGPGIDFTREQVRRFYCENARMWLTEYDVDGLRFDSVHEIKTSARDHFLAELAAACRQAKPHAKLIIENVRNLASLLDRDPATNEPVQFTAQWNDDMHHVLVHLVAGEGRKTGYDDPAKDPYADLEKGLIDGLVHDGEAGDGDDGRTRGGPAARLPPDSFVTYVENHDQIGNRVDGQRLSERIRPDRLDFLNFLKFLCPQIPLCFMGDEANVSSPFPFFVDLLPDEAAEKQKDRYEQMPKMFGEDVEPGDLPDPNAMATFERAKLPWDEYELEPRREALARFRQLGGYRRTYLWPLAATPCLDATSARQGNGLIVNWVFAAGTLTMALNPTDMPLDLACMVLAPPVSTGSFSQHGEVLRLGPWSAVAWVRE